MQKKEDASLDPSRRSLLRAGGGLGLGLLAARGVAGASDSPPALSMLAGSDRCSYPRRIAITGGVSMLGYRGDEDPRVQSFR